MSLVAASRIAPDMPLLYAAALASSNTNKINARSLSLSWPASDKPLARLPERK